MEEPPRRDPLPPHEAHWHDTWSVGVVLSGAHGHSPKATGQGLVHAGQGMIIAPGFVHAGRVVGQSPCRYVMFYPPAEELARVADELGIHAWSGGKAVLDAPNLAAALMENARLLNHPDASGFDLEVAWARTAGLLLENLSGFCPRAPSLYQPQRLLLARNYLHDRVNQAFSLDDLAAAAHLSKYHLCRQFALQFGLSLHRYLRQLRLQSAKRMLLSGRSLAEVALYCGFSDQSHLGRQFKAVYGVTPGTYLSARRTR